MPPSRGQLPIVADRWLTKRVSRLAECLLAHVRKTHVCISGMYRKSHRTDPGHLRVLPLRVVERACLVGHAGGICLRQFGPPADRSRAPLSGSPPPFCLGADPEKDRSPELRPEDAWHSDNSFMSLPGGPTVLYAVKVPVSADGQPFGDTLFADAAAAADGLPAPLRRRAEGRRAAHNAAHNCGVALSEYASGQKELPPDAEHPVLRRNPLSDREALFVSPAYTRRVVGLPPEASASLLRDLLGHATRPEFVHRHRWCEGDLLVWDNGRVLHKATTLEMPPGAERVMWRVQSRGPGIVETPEARMPRGRRGSDGSK
ncbi:unnamed protein product [Prorocentrum cordatum]|uniref:TauD/TfdA-like domain-containing protein n=1 Tax=Prorocentrum cordatum TaxID=2364126 RepID=A0ABN9R865_9DINO|nr:unnamed protein product [Polarella glacialis]